MNQTLDAMRPHPQWTTDEMVDEVLTTALEGGINYWVRSVRLIGTPTSKSTLFPGEEPFLSECLTKGCTIAVTDTDGEERILTRAKMRAGIRRASQHFGLTCEDFHEQHDATMADVAVQLGLLGEIVYG
jgi:hypothetical protein